MTTLSTDSAVSLQHVEKTYGSGRSEVHALRDVSLELPAGELAVVLGPSGSGKTTLLNVAGGIDAPSAGRVVVGGKDLGGLDEEGRTAFRRDTVGFVFQFFNLVPTLTAMENVQLIAELVGAGEQESRAALEGVGLGDRLDHFPGALSGGEQQRVAIARALVKQPSVMLCDEPTGSLDLDTGRQVLAVLRRLNREERRAVVIVTHNGAIARMADRVVHMRSGALEAVEEIGDPIPAEEVTW